MKLVLMLFAAAALAACGGPGPVADDAENALTLPETSQSSPSPTGAAPDRATPAPDAVASAIGKIPAELRGRWGLSPGDCMASHGDEGLLTISASELRFYESVAVPAANVHTSSNSISGEFAFTGEGQEWTRHATLELRDSMLVRTERDPIATFRYVRCD